MKNNFMHWKEAEKRALEVKTELDALNAEITSEETIARSEDTSVERREELIGGIQGKITKRDALQKEYDDAVTVQRDLQDAEKRQLGLLENLSTGRIAERLERAVQRDDVRATREYEVAWAKSVLTNDKAIVRSLINTEDDANAGYLIPTRLANSIKENVFTGGRILSLCSIIDGKGELEQPYLDSTTLPTVHREKQSAEKTEKEVAFAIRRIRTEFIAEWIPVSRKFENNDSGLFFDWLMVKLPQALQLAQENLIFNGAADGSDGFVGILNETNARFVASVPAALTFNTPNIAVAALDDGVEDGAVIVMNRTTFFNEVMALTGTDGHPVYQVMTDNSNRPVFRYGGYRVIFNNNINAYSEADPGEPYMLVGDFKGYTIQYPAGRGNMLRDPYSRKKNNIVEYLSEVEAGGNILELGHFAKVVKEQ